MDARGHVSQACPTRPKITRICARSILTRSRLPDAEYALNPARGCAHGCKYCYAAFTRRFTGHLGDPWGSYVDIKVNAADLVRRIPQGHLHGRHVLLSSVTDPYQRCPPVARNTRRVLEALLPHGPRLEILTKGTLYLRDLDLITRFEDATIGASLSTLDHQLSRAVEPGAALPARRLEALRRARDAGVRTYVFVSPILPHVTDVGAIADKAVGVADRMMFEELNMAAGTYEALVNALAPLVPGVRNKYDIIRKGPSDWWQAREAECVRVAVSRGLTSRYYSHRKRT